MGDMIGEPGNSGNTSAPHLHIHFMDSPSALASDGLPYRYLGFTPTGTIDADQWEAVADDLDDVWRLLPPTDGLPAGEFIPLNLTVGDFSANP
ncbi:Uncharacterised protein [Halioglobus japonicus]|nr:Uncharacterised protein [Halioglobus japonicus]